MFSFREGEAVSPDDSSKRRAALLDKLAGTLEQVGFPRSTARVFAALMMAKGEGLSTSELVEELETSKASITNAMQFLVGTQLVERYRVRGSRQAHYRILKGTWGQILGRKFTAATVVRETAEEALEFVESDLAKERLQEMYDVYAFFETEFKVVMERWNERTRS
jgi:DNA-binding transcriptional regulator GbsR (MarR family)